MMEGRLVSRARDAFLSCGGATGPWRSEAEKVEAHYRR